jgi:CRP/FNR family cyclic AMP-dependent transcriptional regulator
MTLTPRGSRQTCATSRRSRSGTQPALCLVEMHRFTTEKRSPTQPPKDHRPLNLRALLESTRTPFAVAAYGPQAVIFLQGDPCDGVIYIEKGRVRLSVTARSGKEAICGLLGTGAFLGEEVLGRHAVRRQTATAMIATEVLVVPKAQMIRLLRTQPAIADRLIAHVVARHTHLAADVADQLLKSSEQRLARTLLVLAGCDERRPCRCVLPEVSQEIIAEIVGTTRSRVNLFMGKFKKLGFIEEDGGVIEVKPSLLHLVHDGNRGVPRGTSPGTSQAFEAEERYWPLAG